MSGIGWEFQRFSYNMKIVIGCYLLPWQFCTFSIRAVASHAQVSGVVLVPMGKVDKSANRKSTTSQRMM
jgi:hypothetical protein